MLNLKQILIQNFSQQDDNKLSKSQISRISVGSQGGTRKLIDPRNRLSIVCSPSQHQNLMRRSSILDQERFVVKQLWRQLQRWQGFDDYVYLRDPQQLKGIMHKESVQRGDLVEALSQAHNVVIHMDTVLDMQINDQKMKTKYSVLQSSDAFEQKFNYQQYKGLFLRAEKTRLNQLDTNLTQEALRLLNIMNERLQEEEVISISPHGERLIRALWKMGVLNFYFVAILIHNYILETYGKERVAYSNWKKMLRICNLQGPSCHKYKLITYKFLAKISIKLQQYDKSIVYLKKMLKLSWLLADTNYEVFVYDQISLCYYYKQDIQKAIFFHERFTNGDFEARDSPIRAVGEQAYLLTVKMREGLVDQHSFSQDEYDLDILVEKGKFNQWEHETKHKSIFDKEKLTLLKSDPKKGHSFGKIHRPMNTSLINVREAKQKMNEFQQKISVKLGPFYEKVPSQDNLFKTVKKQNEQTQSCQFLFNQKSTNRVSANFLINEELKEQPTIDKFSFKPSENVSFIRKMIKIFEFDLRYFQEHQKLFTSGADLA